MNLDPAGKNACATSLYHIGWQAFRKPAEQVSRNRWHLDIKVAAVQVIDAELLSWAREACELCA